MDMQFTFRGGLVAAVVIGAMALSSATSFAATTGRSGNSSGGSSSTGGGSSPSGNRSSGDNMSAFMIVLGDCPSGIAATNCGGRHRRPVIAVRDQAVHGCDIRGWHHVILPDGEIVEDHRLPMRKACRVVHYED